MIICTQKNLAETTIDAEKFKKFGLTKNGVSDVSSIRPGWGSTVRFFKVNIRAFIRSFDTVCTILVVLSSY